MFNEIPRVISTYVNNTSCCEPLPSFSVYFAQSFFLRLRLGIPYDDTVITSLWHFSSIIRVDVSVSHHQSLCASFAVRSTLTKRINLPR